MDKFKRSLSFRKKKDSTPESSKPHQWQEDENKVREGTCSFQVRYLGCVEVFESRGIQVCEEAIKGLKSGKGKFQRAVIYVSGDALRVVDEISKGLILDQTIEKVSFCAPDRNNEKGFAYICRDGTTRRWMCHGFLTLKESGERLSHAVGCAFTVCLEKKQAREKDKVTVTFNEDGTSFTRTGSFRQTTLTERLADPQSAIIAEPVPVKKVENLYEVQRPRASVDMLQRQNSFRSFNKLAETSPFKRQMSLRLDELSSTIDRQKQFAEENGSQVTGNQSVHTAISPIVEASPMNETAESISQLCQQVTRGLSAMTTADDPFLVLPAIARFGYTGTNSTTGANGGVGNTQFQACPTQHPLPKQATSSTSSNLGEPIRQSNPWAPPSSRPANVSDADSWLQLTANIVGETRNQGVAAAAPTKPYPTNGVVPSRSGPYSSNVPAHPQQPFVVGNQNFVQRAPNLRAYSVDSAYSYQQGNGVQQSIHKTYHDSPTHGGRPAALHHQANAYSSWSSSGRGGGGPVDATASSQLSYDPFDAAWAAKVAGKSTNPFHSIDSSNKSFFKVNL